ncbi:Testis-expressed protein 19B [Cricetulus griseus]|uniref:Testis-expressed protein 19B n=1 Tax=Cricetulus griseus TaxID=10029 RepID=G3GXE3_CRIGR|nr:Testis-expressed protein 19B [Cricetulus griseus]
MDLVVGTCLVSLNFYLVVDGFDTHLVLLSLPPHWAVRTQVQCWHVLLDPSGFRMVHLQSTLEQQDLHLWRLSILESSELVPADCSLWKRGFKVHSCLPWHSDTPEDCSRELRKRLFVREFGLRGSQCYNLYHYFLDNQSVLS